MHSWFLMISSMVLIPGNKEAFVFLWEEKPLLALVQRKFLGYDFFYMEEKLALLRKNIHSNIVKCLKQSRQ